MSNGVFLTMTKKDGCVEVDTKGDSGDVMMALAMALNDLREKTGKDGHFIAETFMATYYAVWGKTCENG